MAKKADVEAMLVLVRAVLLNCDALALSVSGQRKLTCFLYAEGSVHCDGAAKKCVDFFMQMWKRQRDWLLPALDNSKADWMLGWHGALHHSIAP